MAFFYDLYSYILLALQPMLNDKYEVVIGLEVHAQLKTKSKLFCADSTTYGAAPNTQVSTISLAHPGTLPVLNKEVIALAVKLGLALNCKINQHNYFARKNYFYPDLPKGYQISQHTEPICLGGYLTIEVDGQTKNVDLNRIHIEEDAGKSLHDADELLSCIDLNRAGVPLLEIVTEPCMHSAEEAFAYLTELRKLVRWLQVCDGNMEEGSMRCDANISVRIKGEKKLGTRVEVKNLNSIRNVKRAILLEAESLMQQTEKGQTIVQETRSYDADQNTSFSLRSKEEADDYRYFPEPDLPALIIEEDYVQQIKNNLPLLPAAYKLKLINDYGLSDYAAAQITLDKEETDFFERLVIHTKNYKAIANWQMGPLKNYSTEKEISILQLPLSPAKIAELIDFTEEGKVHVNVAGTKLLNAMIEEPSQTAEAMASKLNLLQNKDDSQIEDWIKEVINEMPEKVKEYQAGKKALLGMFAGAVKKKSKGTADMQLTQKLLQQLLNK